MRIFETIEKWDLDSPTLDFNRFSKKQVGQIANDVQNCYLKPPPPSVGRFNQSLATATDIVENRTRAEDLALPLLFSKQLMLPDPLFSLMAPRAATVWKRLPDGNNRSIAKTNLAASQWNNYWATEASERFTLLNASVPILVNRLIKLRPLVESGHIILQPWEVAVESELDSLRPTLIALKKDPDILREVAQRYPQGQYHFGIRAGAINISTRVDLPEMGLKKGDPMWFADPTEVLVLGLIHSIMAKSYSSNLVDTLPGDRVIYDYVRTGGTLRPVEEQVVPSVKVPNLSMALWNDIVAIKKDSELLDQLQKAINEISYCQEADQQAVLKQEISRIEAHLKEDLSLKKYAKLAVSDLGIGTLSVGVCNVLGGATVAVGTMAAVAGTAISFLYKLASEYYSSDNKNERKRRDLVVKLNGQL